METLDDLVPILLCLTPVPLVIWAWARWRTARAEAAGGARARLTLAALVLATLSCAHLVLFPWLLWYLEAHGSARADAWYLRSVLVGCAASIGAMVTSLFAPGGLRLLLAAAGLLMLCLWFMVGVAR